MTPSGFPHSDIPGSTRAYRSPRLIAVNHVLHRLCVPRHPPYALTYLTHVLRNGLESQSYATMSKNSFKTIKMTPLGEGMGLLRVTSTRLKPVRKEVIQPQVPLRLPCYDFTPITPHTFGTCLP